ncbi:MAG: type IV toxin-antitoxin system AbiEi family antitoxin domain-containing protein [Solirubrobacteraceae bacterium]
MASRSHGVVTRAELLRAGITPAEIRHRLSFGALFLEYRGIYRVGHRAPSMEARYLAAAVWACGDEAVLSGLQRRTFGRSSRDRRPRPRSRPRRTGG